MRTRISLFLLIGGAAVVVSVGLMDYTGSRHLCSFGPFQIVGAASGLCMVIAGRLVFTRIIPISARIPEYADIVVVGSLMVTLGILEGTVRIFKLDQDKLHYEAVLARRAEFQPQPIWPSRIVQVYDTTGLYEEGDGSPAGRPL